METIRTPHGVTVSYEMHGQGPALVLTHGGFSDHRTNWEYVLPSLAQNFRVYALARRGRGRTDATAGHSVYDESQDVAAVVRSIGEPVSLLGHSYGAHVALRAALLLGSAVRSLVVYEPPWPSLMGGSMPEPMMRYAAAGDWDNFSFWFFRNLLAVPENDLNAVRASKDWGYVTEDAPKTVGDLAALARYAFRPQEFAGLDSPVLLQVGSESPRDLYVTDALLEVLPNARVQTLAGQAHEGMTTAPDQYTAGVLEFLAERTSGAHA